MPRSTFLLFQIKKMDTRSPKDRVLVALKKGQSDRVLGLISQFPGYSLFLKIISILS